jgi:RimJ/RimL family protein N-acetyltransferase
MNETGPLQTERLRLERFTPRHAALLLELSANPQVMRFVGAGVPWTREFAAEVAAALTEHWEAHGFGWRVAVERASGRAIGFVALNFLGEGVGGLDPGEYELGWWLEPAAWGRGLAFEGAIALKSEAFARLRAPSVIARIQPPNERSMRVAGKLGMALDTFATGRQGEELTVFRLANPRLARARIG